MINFEEREWCEGRMVWVLWLLILAVPSYAAESQEEAQEEASSAARSRKASSDYVHEWMSCPEIDGYQFNGEKADVKAPKGDIHVVVFYASWCVPCQNQVKWMQKLEKKMLPKAIRFSWLFAHDLQADIQGFAKAHGISNPIIVTKETVKAFHNPGLPAVYICDRNGWLLDRMMKISDEDLVVLEQKLHKMSGY